MLPQLIVGCFKNKSQYRLWMKSREGTNSQKIIDEEEFQVGIINNKNKVPALM